MGNLQPVREFQTWDEIAKNRYRFNLEGVEEISLGSYGISADGFPYLSYGQEIFYTANKAVEVSMKYLLDLCEKEYDEMTPEWRTKSFFVFEWNTAGDSEFVVIKIKK